MPNALGRWIAGSFDFRFTGIASLLVVAAFVLLKYRNDRTAISISNCLGVAFSIFTLIAATNVGAIFLLTSPPAFELISRDSLALVGVVTVIAVYMQAASDLTARFRNTHSRFRNTPGAPAPARVPVGRDPEPGA